MTKKRVNTCVDLLQTSYCLKLVWENISGCNITEDTHKVWGYKLYTFKDSELRKSVIKRNAKMKSTFFRIAIKSLSDIASFWKPKTEMITHVLIPEVSLEDEISNEGHNKFLIEFFMLTSIMRKAHYKNNNGLVIKNGH